MSEWDYLEEQERKVRERQKRAGLLVFLIIPRG